MVGGVDMTWRKAAARCCRRWAMWLDGNYVVVVRGDQKGAATMAGYLTALARKKGVHAWVEYPRYARAMKAGRKLKEESGWTG